MMQSVIEYLEKTVVKFPDKIAFADESHSMTFAELRRDALCIANELIHLGLYHQSIAIFMDKSPECVAAFLGVAYSGNFYSPLDKKMPLARLEKILSILQPAAIICQRDDVEDVKIWAKDAKIICYEDVADGDCSSVELPQVVETDVLYVMFTSGSTGVPKGVVIPHKAVINYIEWFVDKFSLSENDILGNQAPLYFDVSIQDIYGTIKKGSTTYFLPRNFFSFPLKLMKYMAERKINFIFWVPSALCVVADIKGLQAKMLPPLTKILFAGEVMPNKQLNMWRKVYPKAVFVNLYGPTEACNVIIYYVIERNFKDAESIPIGTSIANTEVILLNENDQKATNGEMGELCIRGSALSYGYYNNVEQTRKVFVQNPLNKSFPEIIYRTGDLAHLNERGELMYDGRKDFQIKHKGYRIELGEVENVASSLQGVDRICCLYDSNKGGIVLFYTGEISLEDLSAGLENVLPDYMIPNKKIKLVKMPLNANGKIDRVKLKEKL